MSWIFGIVLMAGVAWAAPPGCTPPGLASMDEDQAAAIVEALDFLVDDLPLVDPTGAAVDKEAVRAQKQAQVGASKAQWQSCLARDCEKHPRNCEMRHPGKGPKP